MIYLLAVFLPPLGLLLNGQPFHAIFNLLLSVPCFIIGIAFHPLWLVPAAYAVLVIHMDRERRRHREIVEAIRQHGAPKEWGK